MRYRVIAVLAVQPWLAQAVLAKPPEPSQVHADLATETQSSQQAAVLDVRTFGAKGDGVADDTPAIEAAIRAAGPSRRFAREAVARPEGARVVYFPTPVAHYRVTRRIDIPTDRNFRFLGDSSHSARISMDSPSEHYIFRVLGGDGQRPVIFEKLVLHKGGIEYEGGLRRMQAVRDCAFVAAPDWAIRTLGRSVIAMEVSRSQFTEGNGGINIAFEQSDLWVISHCDFVRNSGVDLRIATSGVHVRDCDFEVKPDPLHPFVQIVSDAAGIRPGNDIVFHNVRFGNESPSAPRDVVVIGPLDGTSQASTGAIWFRDCLWRGAHRQAPSPTNGWSAIRLNQPPVALNVSGSSFWGYHFIIDEAFAKAVPLTAHMPSQNVFADNSLLYCAPDSKLFSAGGIGWSVRGGAAGLLDATRSGTEGSAGRGLPTSNVLPDTDRLDTSSRWSRSGIQVERDLEAQEGLAGHAFRLVVTGQGPPRLSATALAHVGDSAATFSVWLRSPKQWSVALAIAGRGGEWRTSPKQVVATDSTWRRYSVTASALDPSDLLSAFVLPSRPQGVDVPDIHVALPQLERGTQPSAFLPNLEPGVTHAPRGFQGLGLGLLTIEAGEAPPAVGQHSLGDKILNTRPVELGSPGSRYVVDGWRCVKSGIPGEWVELRSPTGN